MTLTLTADELALFQALPEELRKGWKTEEETLRFQDSESRRLTRLEFMKLTSPAMKGLSDALGKAETNADIEAALKGVDFTQLTEQDGNELFFALGPDILSGIIAAFLANTKDANALEDLSDMCRMRHEILVSLQNFNS